MLVLIYVRLRPLQRDLTLVVRHLSTREAILNTDSQAPPGVTTVNTLKSVTVSVCVKMKSIVSPHS